MSFIDPVERRKEQNRNAQRKYRKKQKQSPQAVGGSVSTDNGNPDFTAPDPTPNKVPESASGGAPPEFQPEKSISVPDDSIIAAINSNTSDAAQSRAIEQAEEGTALHFAALHGQISVVKMLLNRGAHHSLQNTKGERPLHLAVKAGHIQIVKLLLSYGADINARSAHGDAVLHLAVNNIDQSMVALLIGSAGIDIDARDGKDRTPLHIAADKGSESILGMLREANADIDARKEDGFTALHSAITQGRSEMVRMLLDYGASQDTESLLVD